MKFVQFAGIIVRSAKAILSFRMSITNEEEEKKNRCQTAACYFSDELHGNYSRSNAHDALTYNLKFPYSKIISQ